MDKLRTIRFLYTLTLIVLLAAGLAACTSNVVQYDAARCYEATPAQIQAINAGVKSVQPANFVVAGWWVKSTDIADTLMLAMVVHGPAVDQKVGPGVWAVSGQPDQPGQILSVSGNAKKFSSYPDSQTVNDQISLTTDGVQEAIWCAQQMREDLKR